MTDELVLRKSIVVACPPEHAFRVFTERMSDWWPYEGHSLFDGEAPVVWEGRVGGRVLERAHDGREGVWGTIVAWDPPRSFAMTWHPGRGEETAQELSVSFTEQDGGTRVDLVHTGWERTDEPAERFASYEAGWATILDLFADTATTAR
ncbi:MAG TPA: SRPBCC domain-containing protein [Gaiellaceae bacterium]|nr:SRPBCC domain-containing protein [Gaiellaceae bacterium]